MIRSMPVLHRRPSLSRCSGRHRGVGGMAADQQGPEDDRGDAKLNQALASHVTSVLLRFDALAQHMAERAKGASVVI